MGNEYNARSDDGRSKTKCDAQSERKLHISRIIRHLQPKQVDAKQLQLPVLPPSQNVARACYINSEVFFPTEIENMDFLGVSEFGATQQK